MSQKATAELLWKALSKSEQDDACFCVFESNDSLSLKSRPKIISALAKKMNFREVTLQRKKAKDNAEHLIRRISCREFNVFWNDLVCSWLLHRHRHMLARFLEASGVKHEEGFVAEDATEPNQSSFAAGIAALRAEFKARDVSIYLAYLDAFGGDFFQNLGPAIGAAEFDVIDLLTKKGVTSELPSAPSGGSDGQPAIPEESEEFTTLDNLLIRSAVAAAFGEIGALRPEQLEDLVEEIVALNASRQISLFHRGFMHALLERPYSFHFPGENEERRLWYLTGVVMGLIRRNAIAECVELIRRHKDLTKRIAENRSVICGQMLLPHIWGILWDAEEFGLLRNWISNHLASMPAVKQETLLMQIHHISAAMLRRGVWTEAKLFLDIIDEHLVAPNHLDQRFVALLKPPNDRKRAQALQLQGHFAPAIKLLEPLGSVEGFDDASNAVTDLALAQAGFRSLSHVLPRADEAACRALRDGLAAVETLLQETVAEHDVEATNAHFCLGVLKSLGGAREAQWAADHFKAAMVGMVARQESYEEGGLLAWARFLLGLALLETADPAQYHNATERISQVIEDGVLFPLWLWKRALEAAMVFDDNSLAQRIAEHILNQPRDEALPVLWQSGIAKQTSSIRLVYLEWLMNESHPTRQKWDHLRELLVFAIRGRDYAQAGDILDALEGIAVEGGEYRREFIDLLKDERNYSPVWTPTEVENSLVRFLELEGRHREAAALLHNRFFQSHGSGEPGAETDARAIVERIQEYRLPDFDISDLERLLIPDTGTEAAPESPARPALNVTVLYVGGDETQKAYEQHIRAELEREYPGIRVRFYFPGWTSRWNAHLEKVKGIVPQVHAVVLNRLVRTQFGRHVRAACDSNIPWFPCTGRGKASLKRSIIRAAEWAAAAGQPG